MLYPCPEFSSAVVAAASPSPGNVLRLVILVVEQHRTAAGQDTGCGLLHITVMSKELLGIVPYWQHI